MEFSPFPKIPRLSREVVVTEKIDGTNASILITEELEIFAGSRTRWITADHDNYGFARWVIENKTELLTLGPGHHFGEWWGKGIQRGYNQIEKKFSLFNTAKWSDPEVRPECCGVVPVLWTGLFDTTTIDSALYALRNQGSVVAPGYPYPEGVVVFHTAGNHLYKKLLENDEQPKNKI